MEPRYYVDEAGCVRDSALDTSAMETDSELSGVEIVERLNKTEELQNSMTSVSRELLDLDTSDRLLGAHARLVAKRFLRVGPYAAR